MSEVSGKAAMKVQYLVWVIVVGKVAMKVKYLVWVIVASHVSIREGSMRIFDWYVEWIVKHKGDHHTFSVNNSAALCYDQHDIWEDICIVRPSLKQIVFSMVGQHD